MATTVKETEESEAMVATRFSASAQFTINAASIGDYDDDGEMSDHASG